MRFTIFQDSHIGGRKSNQDRLAYSYSKDILLMVIADGMGGHARGEIAAEVAVTSITDRFQKEGARGTFKRPKEFLENAIQGAHRAIATYADAHHMLECPRTTIVVCIVQNGQAVWAHSGDSRLYIFRGGKLVKRTMDHSRVQQLMDAGVLTPEGAAVHPDRNKIYNCLGSVLPPFVTVSEDWALRVGDTILLSTDGFWAPLAAEDIAARLERENILDLVPMLLLEAEEKVGRDADNLSAVALTWEHQEAHAESSTATVTATMPIDSFTTSAINSTQQLSLGKDDVTDEDIERAILEIQNAIKRVAK